MTINMCLLNNNRHNIFIQGHGHYIICLKLTEINYSQKILGVLGEDFQGLGVQMTLRHPTG